MRALVLAACGMLSAAAPGCLLPFLDFSPLGSTESPPYRRLKREELWDRIKEVVNKEFRLKEINEEDLLLVSEWEEHLGPMSSSGMRRRANVWVHEGDRGPYLEVQVEREKNVEMKHTLDPNMADWESDGRDVAAERRLIYLLEAKLGLREQPSPDALRPSPYRATGEETDADRERRLWGGLEQRYGKGKPPAEAPERGE